MYVLYYDIGNKSRKYLSYAPNVVTRKQKSSGTACHCHLLCSLKKTERIELKVKSHSVH